MDIDYIKILEETKPLEKPLRLIKDSYYYARSRYGYTEDELVKCRKLSKKYYYKKKMENEKNM